jgi:hypothetical protein
MSNTRICTTCCCSAYFLLMRDSLYRAELLAKTATTIITKMAPNPMLAPRMIHGMNLASGVLIDCKFGSNFGDDRGVILRLQYNQATSRLTLFSYSREYKLKKCKAATYLRSLGGMVLDRRHGTTCGLSSSIIVPQSALRFMTHERSRAHRLTGLLT